MTMSSKWSKNGNYYINCMTLDDYYANMGAKEPPGEWYIAANSQDQRSGLGLTDAKKFEEEDTESFDNICKGYNPDTGEKLMNNAGDPKRRALLDLTFSPDKSVSVVWAFASGEHKDGIQQDQREAVRAALDFGSKMGAYGRQVVRESYKDARGEIQHRRKVVRVKTSYIGALFEHGSSRADDPQLHTHATILNACVRPDGTTGAIESSPLMKWQGAMASIYHASLAHKLRQRGCAIEMTGNTFRVAGVPDSICEAFSQRRKAIVAYAEEWQRQHGMTADASRAGKGLLQMATIETRDAKDELTREQLQEEWVTRGKELGYTEQEAREVFQLGEPCAPMTREELQKEARAAIERILDTDATFKGPALVTRVAIHLTGRASIDEILQAVEDVKPELVASQELDEETGEYETVYSTHEMLLTELDLQNLSASASADHRLDAEAVEAAIERQDADSKAAATADFIARNGREPTADEVRGLEEEQAAAIRHACLGDKTTSVIEGTAGAGKTFTMKIVGQLFTGAGYKVHGLSGAWTQALNLQKEAQLDSGRAIAGWLIDVQKGSIELGKRDVVVMDEAGMVGVRDMRAVMAAVEKAGAKLILLGDTLQQNSVAAGDALRTVTEVAGSQRLDVIRRQVLEEDRAAVPLIFAGRGREGLQTYIEKGQVHLCADDDQTDAKLIGDWQSDRARHPGKSQVIIATTNAEVSQLNRLAHESRKLHGELGDSVQLLTMDAKNATDLVEFSVGDQVVFRSNQRDLGRNHRASEAAAARRAIQEDRAAISAYGKGISSIAKLERQCATLAREIARDDQAISAGKPSLSPQDRIQRLADLAQGREAVQGQVKAMAAHFSEQTNRQAVSIALRLNRAIDGGETGLGAALREHKAQLVEISSREAAEPSTAKDERAEAVFNRTTSTIEAIDAKTGVLSIRTDDGKLVEVNPKDNRWQHRDKDGKADGLALQHAYAVTATSSQGMTRDLAYSKHHEAMNRRSAGVVASRHREELKIYANKESLYEAKMRKTDATEWHHIAKFSDGEALDRMGQTWSRKSDKTSTLDYAAWNDAKGDRVHTAEELSLARLDEARAHIEQLRAGQDAEQEMPFQLESSYTLLPLEKLKGAEAREAREHVMDNLGATAKVLDEAQRQGFIEMRRDDERGYTPSFAGRRPGDDAIVNRLRDGQPNREEGALRDRYPPILKGDPKEVHIVATGEDALAIWSNRERENKPKPTVIVAGDNVGEAVQLQHVRDTLRRADKPPVLWPSERMSRQQSKEAGKEVAEASGKQVSVKLATAPANQLQHDLHQERASMAKKEAARLKEKQNTLGG